MSDRDQTWLKQSILREVSTAFEDSNAPDIPCSILESVDTLFRVFAYRAKHAALVDAGRQCLDSLTRAAKGDLADLANRCEPFAKMLLALVNPTFYTAQDDKPKNYSFATVLTQLGMADRSVLSRERPKTNVTRNSYALEDYVHRVYQARNTAAHEAVNRDALESAIIFKSVCVFLVYAVSKHRPQIERGLLVEGNESALEKLRMRFSKWGPRHVNVFGEESITEEPVAIDPLATELEQEESQRDQDDLVGPVPERDQESLPRTGRVTDIIGEIQTLVFLGEAGSGKTTTLQYLTWRLLTELLENRSQARTYPVYIELNRCGPEPGFSLRELIANAAYCDSVDDPAFVAAQPLILLDGLNEVRADYIDAVTRDLRSVVENTNLRVVITSRPSSYHSNLPCPVFELLRLSDSQIEQLIHKHFPSSEEATAFISTLRQHSKLWEWGRNPLLLAMLARVGLRRKGTLPENQGRLMDAFIRDLLGREEYQKHQQFEEPLKVQLLAGLAYHTRAKGQIAFDYVQACVFLQSHADRLGSRADIPQFISEVVDNNVLARDMSGSIAFEHEMYQEYFAALEIDNQTKVDRRFPLALHTNPLWEEPLVLFSGITSQRTTFIRDITPVNPLLATRALMSAVQAEEYLRDGIISAARAAAASFSQPERAARSLVALVELRDFDGLKVVFDHIQKPTKHHRRAIQDAISRANSQQVLDLLASLEHKRNRTLLNWAVASTQQCGVFERSPPGAGVKLTFLDHLATRSLRDMRHAIEIFRRFGFCEQAHASNLLHACDLSVRNALERIRFTGGDLPTDAIQAAYELAHDFNLETAFQPVDRAREFYTANKLVGFHPFLTLAGESHVVKLVHELVNDSDERVRCFALCVILNRSLDDQFKPSALIRAIFSEEIPTERLKRIIKLLARTDELSRYAPLIRERLTRIAATAPLELRTLQRQLREWPSATAPADVESLFSKRFVTKTNAATNELPITEDEAALSIGDALTQLVTQQVEEHQNRIEAIAWRRESIRVASLFTGKVTNITESGVSVRVDDDIEGVIRDLDRPPTKYLIEHGVDIGTEVEVEILRTFEHEDVIWLVLSRYQWKPWQEILLHRRSGTWISGVVRKVHGFGAVIELDVGLTGFLHVSEAADAFVDDIAKVLRVGDHIKVRVVRLDKRSGRINLSARMPSDGLTKS